MTKYKCLYDITGRIEDVATFLVPLKELPKQPVEHWSDCAVNSEPAYPAGECDCGGFKQYQDEVMCQACEFGQCTAKAGCVAISNPPPKQEQGEPVAITITGKLGNIYSFTGDYSLKKGDKVYTKPTQRTWVGLTDVEWMNIVNKDQAWFGQRPDEVAHEVAKLVEAKLKEKNT
jgi:hypothetical protein